MKRKLIALLMSVGLVASLAACGSSAPASSSAPAESSAEEPASEEAEPASSEAESEAEPASEAESAAESAAESVEEATGGIAGKKIGITIPVRDQYFSTFETALVENLEAAGVGTAQVVLAGEEDILNQMSQVETFKNNGFDAVLIAMSTGGSGPDFMELTGDMKVLFFNRAVEESVTDGVNVAFVGMAEYDAGYAQGKWLAEHFNAEGKTDLKGLMFMGPLGQASVTNRTQGAKDALADGGCNVEWIFEQTAEWDRAKAMNLFTQFIGTGAEFDFVCANNDEMALGVIEACAAANIPVDFPIVGVDATEPGCNAIVDGTLAMTVNQDPKGQAVACVETFEKLLSGQSVEPQFHTSALAITTDNVDEILAQFGG